MLHSQCQRVHQGVSMKTGYHYQSCEIWVFIIECTVAIFKVVLVLSLQKHRHVSFCKVTSAVVGMNNMFTFVLCRELKMRCSRVPPASIKTAESGAFSEAAQLSMNIECSVYFRNHRDTLSIRAGRLGQDAAGESAKNSMRRSGEGPQITCRTSCSAASMARTSPIDSRWLACSPPWSLALFRLLAPLERG